MDSGKAQRDAGSSDGTQENENVSQNLDAMYVKLISSDDQEFIIKRKDAMMSQTIETMLMSTGNFVERQTNVIRLPHIESRIMNMVCKYLVYRRRYQNSSDAIPEFPISQEDSRDYLHAANYLNC